MLLPFCGFCYPQVSFLPDVSESGLQPDPYCLLPLLINVQNIHIISWVGLFS